ncbi:acyl carrier protein [Paractinoplanes rhizophilus]|uniref:Acyl carrier protein n=1 Tax=Paractinoplanes rhizophilus TaxID=1416877 RepID=A0ABW2HZW8_9ACTN|nr:phosphopantetheine-binding protein [Actinoplanes sp.]
MTSVDGDIRNFIAARYPTADIGDNDDIFALGYVNSLFAMELVVFIERHFAIAIPNDELRIDNFRTVKAMTGLVERQLPAGGAGR